jgi:hypothetical protein
MDLNFYPFLNINHPDQELLNSIVYNPFSSIWLNDTVVRCYFNIQDANIEIDSLDLQIGYGKDKSGNTQTFIIDNNFIDLDTKNPSLLEFYLSSQIIDGSQNYWANIQIYDEPMDETSQPMINFSPMSVTSILEFNDNDSYWIDDFRYNSVYSISPSSFENDLISLSFIAAKDKAGNLLVENIFNDYLNFVLSAPASTGGLTNGVLLFPNPASPSEIVTVLFDNPVQLQKISLYDYTGRLIKSFKIDNMSNKYELLLPFLSKGNYFLMLESNEYILNKKLVIK